MKNIQWPEGKQFAFTIVDDTDNATEKNVKPVYDLLHLLGIRTTKTIWVYPPRDSYSGECLLDENYMEFVKDLQQKGFEIALHNVGSGNFTTREIGEGFEAFREKLGKYPQMHINHAENPDSIYWGRTRFTFPVNRFNTHKTKYGIPFSGECPDSPYFWGDISKKNIKYIRNRVFSSINTLKCDPNMPYREKKKEKFSNYWFSSSDGANLKAFSNLIKKENVDLLEKEGGACIVYTHFTNDFLTKEGRVDTEFKELMAHLSERNGWFVPASTLLDFLLNQKTDSEFLPAYKCFMKDVKWVMNRLSRKY